MPTSYEFHQLPLTEIFVAENRQRKELRGIDELAGSISRNGLIHPVVVRRSGQLVAGQRRFTAFQQLGLATIPVHYLDELDEFEVVAIELEENLRRIDLTWQENCLATNEYHQLHQSRAPQWTIAQTAEAIGLGSKQIGKIIQVAKRLVAGDKRIASALNFTAAYSLIQRAMSRAVETEMSQISTLTSVIAGGPEPEPKPKATEIDASVQVGDFLTWAPAYKGRKFNLLHCDFPYGIGYEKTTYGGSETWEKYEDSPETYFALLNCLIASRKRLLFRSAHLVFWFSMKHYAETLTALQDGGFRVQPFPLIWTKDRGIIPDPRRGPRRVYETAFLASLGDRKSLSCPPNVFYHKISKDQHLSTKPQEMLTHFLRMVVDEQTEILDPTCGSGSALAAAKALGAKRALGLDISEEHVKTSELKLTKTRRLQDEKARPNQ